MTFVGDADGVGEPAAMAVEIDDLTGAVVDDQGSGNGGPRHEAAATLNQLIKRGQPTLRLVQVPAGPPLGARQGEK